MDPSARLSCTPEPGSPHYLLRLEIPRYRVQRRIRLTSAALEVLQQDPDIGPRLDLSQDSD
jgi:hypothetical protein